MVRIDRRKASGSRAGTTELLRLAAIATVLALLAAGCGGPGERRSPAEGGGSGTTVGVELEDFSVKPEAAEAPAGPVTFDLTANGTHNFVVLKTDLPPDELPTTPSGAADPTAEGIVVVGFLGLFSGPNELRVVVDRGSHVLICNIVDHYSRGMSAGFTVV